MLVLWRDLRDHLRADFRPGLYLATALWAALLLTVNYTLDFEDTYIDSFSGQTHLAGFVLLSVCNGLLR